MNEVAAFPPDQHHRDRILSALDTSIMIEAAAGSGKTSMLVFRTLALLREGKATPEQIIVMTFTRKAAAELRTRLQLGLEKAFRTEDDPEIHARFSHALEHLDQLFVGTIHSFCGKLLREFPMEVNIPSDFEEMDEHDEQELRQKTWENYLTAMSKKPTPAVTALRELGIDLWMLERIYHEFSNYADIELWPVTTGNTIALPELTIQLQQQLRYMEEFIRKYRIGGNRDRLTKLYRRLPNLARMVNWKSTADVCNFLDAFTKVSERQLQIDKWPGSNPKEKKERAHQELDKYLRFVETVLQPALAQWHALRYSKAIPVLKDAIAFYQQERYRQGRLSFQDLLHLATQLLRGNLPLRQLIQKKWTHFLIDEFQDTDPLQAELLMLLSARETKVTDWKRCHPKPGSLCIVGDPQQSIYRFRRADLHIYEAVKEQILSSGGEVVPLQANFRSASDLVQWFNEAFEQLFPNATTKYQTTYKPMLPTVEESGLTCSILRLAIPDRFKTTDAIAQYEAETIADWIVSPQGHLPHGTKKINPSQVLILTRTSPRLSLYAHILNSRGIPHQVSGGKSLNQLPVLRLIWLLLQSVLHPSDGAAWVGLLRSEWFGFSDQELFTLKQQGYRWQWTTSLSPSDNDPLLNRLATIHTQVKQFAEELQHQPTQLVLERFIYNSGLGIVSFENDGENGPLNLFAALQWMRKRVQPAATPWNWLAALHDLRNGIPKMDGATLPSQAGTGVRVMNLHKAKGLEADYVFLADAATGSMDFQTFHIDREGNQPRGYCQIKDPRSPFPRNAPTIAKPLEWESYSQEESHYTQAEELRLLYVAATRARKLLVVSQCPPKARNKDQSPWRQLVPFTLSSFSQKLTPRYEKMANSHLEKPDSVEYSVQTLHQAWQSCLEHSVSDSELNPHDSPSPHDFEADY